MEVDLWEKVLMIQGKIDQNGKSVYTHNTFTPFVKNEPYGSKTTPNPYIDLKNLRYVYGDKIFDLDEIPLPKAHVICYLSFKWRGFDKPESIGYSLGRVYKSNDSVLFISEEYKEKIAKGYEIRRSYLLFKNGIMKGYRKSRGKVEVFCLIRDKKMKIIFKKLTKDFSVSMFPFLLTIPIVEDLDEFDKSC